MLALDDPKVPELAQRMAQKIAPAPDILAALGIATADYRLIAATPYFRKLVAEAAAAWRAPDNIEQRIAAKAAVALETNLPHMSHLASNGAAPPAARVGAFKELRSLTRIGQAEERPGGMAARERFVLNIILEPPAGGAAVAGVEAMASIMAGGALAHGGHSRVTIEGVVEERDPDVVEEDEPPAAAPAPPPTRLTREQTFRQGVASALDDLRDWA